MIAPKGWRLVPEEPTEEMIEKAVEASDNIPMWANWDTAKACWSGMLTAAPSPPDAEVFTALGVSPPTLAEAYRLGVEHAAAWLGARGAYDLQMGLLNETRLKGVPNAR